VVVPLIVDKLVRAHSIKKAGIPPIANQTTNRLIFKALIVADKVAVSEVAHLITEKTRCPDIVGFSYL
jgi:hypothetical protein